MADDDTTERDATEQPEADAQAVSDELQRRLFEVLNDPSMNWARVPHCTALGLAEVFVKVLAALALTDPTDLAFGVRLIAEVHRQLIARAGPPSTPGELLH